MNTEPRLRNERYIDLISLMNWNWQQNDWPHFSYDLERTRKDEEQFLLASGQMFGAFSSLPGKEQNELRIQLLSDEALLTSQIEGEILDRDSLQSSLQRQFGLKGDQRKVSPAEKGVSELLINLYQEFEAPLTNDRLKGWHKTLMQGRTDLEVGCYRTDKHAMQIVSGPVHDPVVHYEAPSLARLPKEMQLFLKWFEESRQSLPALARSAVAHLYFESLHPFEDGNGRIGRALSELSLSQSVGQPLLVALSQKIEENRKRYYDQLARGSRASEITEWVRYFSKTILEAQQLSVAKVGFLVSKAKFFNRFAGQVNERQKKVILRIFREGLGGFQGGLSASNYRRICGASPATVTRDLDDLVRKGAFTRSGEKKGTRYELNLES